MGRCISSLRTMGRICEFASQERRGPGLILSSKVFISFGGLLMALEGSYKKLVALHVDYVYLLIKK